MKANFGYADASGEFYITLETDQCSGCSECVTACRAHILELANNEFDPFAEGQIAVVKRANRKTIKYDCGPCKPPGDERVAPCITACRPGAISHSW